MLITTVTLNHVDHVFSVTSNVCSQGARFTCRSRGQFPAASYSIKSTRKNVNKLKSAVTLYAPCRKLLLESLSLQLFIFIVLQNIKLFVDRCVTSGASLSKEFRLWAGRHGKSEQRGKSGRKEEEKRRISPLSAVSILIPHPLHFFRLTFLCTVSFI